MKVNVFTTRKMMGIKAGKDVEKQIISILKEKQSIRMIFAAAPSQNELLDYLTSSKKIEWRRITAFSMDEYIGLNANNSHSFSSYLNKHIFQKVKLKKVNLINGKAPINKEIKRYSTLINEIPIDIVCLGIGENGHIAFIEPQIADFEDKEILKRVQLAYSSRVQQVNEKCFKKLEDVPKEALSLTIPVLTKANFLFCVVPGERKKESVFNALKGPVRTQCPASILQKHHNCRFYFDTKAYSLCKHN